MLESELVKKKLELEQLLDKVNAELKNVPSGHLRISKSRQRIQYFYIKEKNDTHGKYISKKSQEFVKALAQKDYLEKLKKESENELKYIEKLLKNYSDEGLSGVYEKLNEYRRELADPYVLSDEEFVKRWLEKPYEKKGFAEFDHEYITMNNERVRSKSEILIANALYRHGIPYKYECPVYLNGFGNVYIDFTILLLPSREECYLEHFGMMDQDNYLNDFFRKLSTFIRNGIIPGKNFYMLFESSKHPLNMRDLDLFLDGIQSSR